MCNSWLLYQRVCRDRGDINRMPLAEFGESVAITMCRLGSNITQKRGRPSTEIDVALLTKYKKLHVSALQPKEVRKDQTGHWPIWNNNRLRSKLPDCESRSYVNCSKCNLTLCLNKEKNCFYKFHNQ